MAPTRSADHFSIYYAVAGLVLVYFVYTRVSLYIARRKFKLENGCKPITHKYPHKDPILGIDLLMENIRNVKAKKLLELGYARFVNIGPTFSLLLLGRPTVATIEPENVKTILSLRFKDFRLGQRMETLGPLLGRGIFTTDGDFWAHSRAMIRPNFTKDQVANLDAFEGHIRDLFKKIPRDGSTVDLQELFFRFTIDSATEFLFGESVNTLRHADSAAGEFATAFNRAQDDASARFRLGFLRNFPTKSKKEADQAIKICHAFVDQFVQQAIEYRAKPDVEKDPKGSYVFLHELARQTGDKQRLRDELLNVLLAGRDTTASLLSIMFFILARRPDIWNKLRAEVEMLDEQLPTYDKLRNLKYLKYCLNESKPLLSFTFLCIINYLHPFHYSPSPLSNRPRQRPSSCPRHPPTSRRRARWKVPDLHFQGHHCHLLDVRDASPQGLLRRGCRGVQTGTLGVTSPGLGVSAIQRWPADLSRPAVCAH